LYYSDFNTKSAPITNNHETQNISLDNAHINNGNASEKVIVIYVRAMFLLPIVRHAMLPDFSAHPLFSGFPYHDKSIDNPLSPHI